MLLLRSADLWCTRWRRSFNSKLFEVDALTPRPDYRLRGCRSRRELHMCLAGSARRTHGVIINLTGLYDAARASSMRLAAGMGSGRVVRAKCMM